MSEIRRSEFVRRISTVGWGARESVQILLGRIVSDIRDGILHNRYDDGDLDEVVAFHDATEALWKDSIATNPPLERHQVTIRLKELLEASRTPALGEFERHLERGVRLAESFASDQD
ncbi:MAG: hypothetical protein V3T28_03940 [Gemmatimonadales bacterium]